MYIRKKKETKNEIVIFGYHKDAIKQICIFLIDVDNSN